MKNEQLFNETVAILVKAYQKGDLEYADCAKCAVGNLVAAKNPCADESLLRTWGLAMNVSRGTINIGDQGSSYYNLLLTTGYSAQECALIEMHFYMGCFGISEDQARAGETPVIFPDENQFNGLMSVVDCLMKIHEADQETADKAKELFVHAT